ncbi:MAG: histidine phosphatase family protein [Clostridia bacterium]|nr:histidine phosphatase family protein [Clostridia bacterium]
MTTPKLLFELLLVRHGQSRGNAGVVSGDGTADRQDAVLSENGRRQAALLAERFQAYPLDALFSSGLRRAVQTASAVAAAQPENGAHRVEILPLLTECNIREDYCGQPLTELRKLCPSAGFAEEWTQTQTVLPNDEQTDAAYNVERAGRALAYFKDRFHSGERVMVVAHGMFNTIFLMQALSVEPQRFDPDFANTSVTRLSFYEAGTGPWGFDVRLHELNDHAHLFGQFPEMRYEIQGGKPDEAASLS